MLNEPDPQSKYQASLYRHVNNLPTLQEVVDDFKDSNELKHMIHYSQMIEHILQLTIPKGEIDYLNETQLSKEDNQEFYYGLQWAMKQEEKARTAFFLANFGVIFEKLSNRTIDFQIYLTLTQFLLSVYKSAVANTDTQQAILNKVLDIFLLYLKNLIDLVKSNLENQTTLALLQSLQMVYELYVEKQAIYSRNNLHMSLNFLLGKLNKVIAKNHEFLFEKIEKMTHGVKINFYYLFLLGAYVDYREYKDKQEGFRTYKEFLNGKKERIKPEKLMKNSYILISNCQSRILTVIRMNIRITFYLYQMSEDLSAKLMFFEFLCENLKKTRDYDSYRQFLLSILKLKKAIQYNTEIIEELCYTWFEIILDGNIINDKIDYLICAESYKILFKENSTVYPSKLVILILDDKKLKQEALYLLIKSIFVFITVSSKEDLIKRVFDFLFKLISSVSMDGSLLVTWKAFLNYFLSTSSKPIINFFVNGMNKMGLSGRLFEFIVLHNQIIKHRAFTKENFWNIYEYIKEFLFSLTHLFKQKKAEDLSLPLFKYREVVMFTEQIAKIDFQTHRQIKKLVRNFCYNLEEYLPKGVVDNKSLQIRLDSKVLKTSGFLDNVLSYYSAALFTSPVLLTNRNINLLCDNTKSFKVGRWELTGFGDPIQIYADIRYIEQTLILFLKISNISEAIVKDLELTISKNYDDTFNQIQHIIIDNFPSKSNKNFEFDISFVKLDSLVLKLSAKIRNLEIDEVDILNRSTDSDNQNNRRIQLSNDSYDEMNVYTLNYQQIQVPFYQFFFELKSERLEQQLNFFVSKESFYTLFLSKRSKFHCYFFNKAERHIRWFMSFRFNKLFCIRDITGNKDEIEVLTNSTRIYHLLKDECEERVF